jgi:hypothetical protein
MVESTTKTWGNHTFEKVCIIRLERDGAGNVREFTPQAQYRNRKGLPLNPYGHGPFCKFRIPNDQRFAGVYVLTVDQQAIYVGECINLSSRYNKGYGTISPRNCYSGGQLTNCRINNMVYKATKAGQQIELWFCRTDNRKDIESELINTLSPKWNRQGAG